MQLRRSILTGTLLVTLLATAVSSTRGGDVILKNGMILRGRPVLIPKLLSSPQSNAGPVPNYPILLVANDLARYFVPRLQVESWKEGVDIEELETFRFQTIPMSKTVALGRLGAVLATTPFDPFGHRSITLQTPMGPLNVFQGITKLNANYAKIVGLNVDWETAMATSSIPPDIVEAILKKAIKPHNTDQRLAVVRFLVEAQRFKSAFRELEEIEQEFPELKAKCEEVRANLTQAQATTILEELKLRQRAGQYLLAQRFAQQFPTKGVSGAILQDVREFISAFEEQKEQAEMAVASMGELQAQLKDSKLEAEVAPLRAEIAERIHPANLDRLEAYLKLSADPKLLPADKLGLALSGWAVGSNNAVPDIQQALNLWKARYLLRTYMRTSHDDTLMRDSLRTKLNDVEGVGPKSIAQMLPLLPPFMETPPAPGTVERIQVSSPTEKPAVAYQVMLPLEYHPDRAYPVIISMHDLNHGPEQMIQYWGGTTETPGQAQRHGYIVIAPEWLDPRDRAYSFKSDVHKIVLESLYDARRRFNIDSDRIFLAGHGLGGDAAYDLAFAHPDLWAGVMPMNGVAEKICDFIWQNGKTLPFYILNGEFDRGSLLEEPRNIPRMMTYKFNMIFAEYRGGGGGESYSAEIHRLFEWMSHLTRERFPKDIEMQVLRPTDNQYFWFQFEGLPKTVVEADWTAERPGRVTAMKVAAHINEGNNVIVDSRAGTNTVLLSPDFINFEKRVEVRVNGKTKFNGFLEPEVKVMLDDLHRRGDRQRIYWKSLTY